MVGWHYELRETTEDYIKKESWNILQENESHMKNLAFRDKSLKSATHRYITTLKVNFNLDKWDKFHIIKAWHSYWQFIITMLLNQLSSHSGCRGFYKLSITIFPNVYIICDVKEENLILAKLPQHNFKAVLSSLPVILLPLFCCIFVLYHLKATSCKAELLCQ